MQAINNIVIPEYHDKRGDSITKAKVVLPEGDPKDFSLNYNAQSRSIDLNVDNLMGELSAFFIY